MTSHLFPDLVWRMPVRSRVAYITFDDGPTPFLTAPLLDLLARHEVTASFFLLGRHAARDAGLVRAMYEAGHTIGNHTYTHPDAWRTPAERVISELERTTALLEDQIQAPIRWMRPPYGRFTPSIRGWCLARKHHLTMWDVMPGDFLRGATSENIARTVLSAIRPGSIVVLHDNLKASPHLLEALDVILARLRDDGWHFAGLHGSAARPQP